MMHLLPEAVRAVDELTEALRAASKQPISDEVLEHREAWCKALKSGNYVQGQRALQADGKYCCLGVACDVSNLGSWHERDGDDVRLVYQVEGDSGSFLFLPNEVAEYYGLDNITAQAFAPLNDAAGADFQTIANLIDYYLIKPIRGRLPSYNPFDEQEDVDPAPWEDPCEDHPSG